MAENAVVMKEQLTDDMVETGDELLRKLDESGLPIQAAFWMFMPEINEWRLLIASPEVSAKGPLSVYERIRVALEQMGEKALAAPLSMIGLLDADAELVRLFRSFQKVRQGVGRLRLSKNAINGHFIDDALIYRVI